MSEAKKSKSKSEPKVEKKSAWDKLLETTEAAGGSEFHVGGCKFAFVSSTGGLCIGGDRLGPDQARAFAAWITAWFGTEVKP